MFFPIQRVQTYRLKKSVTLTGLKRSKKTMKKWEDKFVLIYDKTEDALWRENGMGLTTYIVEAGVYSMSYAVSCVSAIRDREYMFFELTDDVKKLMRNRHAPPHY